MDIVLGIAVTLVVAIAVQLILVWRKKRMFAKMMHRHLKKGLFSIEEYQEYARKRLPRSTFDYFTDGAGNQSTQQDNETAFKRYRLRQRVLKNIAAPDMSTTLLDSHVTLPIGLGPVLRKSWAWPKGDLCSARAAGEYGICEIVPCYSEQSLEEIARVNTESIKWLQIYLSKQAYHKELIRRAEAAGYKAIVVTVDGHWKRIVYSDWRNMIFKHMLKTTHGNFNGDNFIKAYSQHVVEHASWDDIQEVTKITNLPIILKGIMEPEDALLAIKYGAKAIIVSNHGGRMMDSLPGALDVLPNIVKAVNGEIEVYLDGGVRYGGDILKALALGAKACFIGRPLLYGLSYQGEEGVKQVLNLLKEDLERAMLCTGCKSISQIGPSVISEYQLACCHSNSAD
uniref:Hydroxyacid oxidase 1-like n=1 Tax=Saccoglossus kowalevskii TaxID=10224 RepID=A0ABM0M9E4_SACKO